MDKDIPLGLRFTILHRLFRKKLEQRLGEKDLTGVQFGTVCALVRLEKDGKGPISQRDLERAAHATHPTMTEILKKLEKKGLVQCRTSQSDRRCKVLSATKEGFALVEEMADADGSVFLELTQELTGEQRNELISLIDTMLNKALVFCEKGNENSD